MRDEEIRRTRLHSQRLAGNPVATVEEAVAHLVGVQAQSMPPARLALRPRTTGTTASDVDRADLVRTWAMRGTLHLLAAADAQWIVELFGPITRAAGRRRREQLGLDEDLCERALPAIEQVLRATGPLPRAALIERLAGDGIHVDPSTQAPAHLMLYAATHGLICRGADDTYRLGAERLHGVRSVRANRPADPVAELARRYLAAYHPAAAADFIAWSGLPSAVARRAFEATVDEAAGVPDGEPRPTLLGHWDTLLLGYRRRDAFLDPSHARAVQAGGGILRPIVLVDGRVVGTWRLERGTVRVEPFGTLPRGSRAGLDAEIADIDRYLSV